MGPIRATSTIWMDKMEVLTVDITFYMSPKTTISINTKQKRSQFTKAISPPNYIFMPTVAKYRPSFHSITHRQQNRLKIQSTGNRWTWKLLQNHWMSNKEVKSLYLGSYLLYLEKSSNRTSSIPTGMVSIYKKGTLTEEKTITQDLKMIELLKICTQ